MRPSVAGRHVAHRKESLAKQGSGVLQQSLFFGAPASKSLSAANLDLHRYPLSLRKKEQHTLKSKMLCVPFHASKLHDPISSNHGLEVVLSAICTDIMSPCFRGEHTGRTWQFALLPRGKRGEHRWLIADIQKRASDH